MGNKPYINTIANKFLYCTISFLANALLTRALGLQLKGEYSWILNYASIISIIAGLGIYQSIPYFVRSDEKKDWVEEYVNIFSFQAIVYIVIIALVGVIKKDSIIWVIIGLLAVVDIFSQQLNMLLLVDKIFKRNMVFIAGAFVNFIFCLGCFLCAKNNLTIALISFFLVKLFYIFSYLYILGKIPKPFNVSLKSILDKVKFGYLPMLSFLMITLNYKVDVLMLKDSVSVSAEALSLYTAGVSIAEIAWVIPDGFKEVLFSRTSNKNNDDEVAAALRVSNIVTLIAIIGILIFGKLVIGIFFGKDFISAHKVTVLLFIGIPSMSWFKIIYTLFNAKGKRKTSFCVLLGSTLLNILLNYLTIPVLNIYGAAVSSVVSYGLCGILFLILYSKDSGNSLSSLFIMRKNDLRRLIGRDTSDN